MLFQVLFMGLLSVGLGFGTQNTERLATDMSDLLETVTATFTEFDQRLEDISNHLLAQDV